MVIAPRIEHVVGKGKRNYSVIMTSKLFYLSHFRPAINSNFSVIAPYIKMVF